MTTMDTTPNVTGVNLTYSQASRHPGWISAMNAEMDSILKNQTYELVELLPGKKTIMVKWVYKTKTGLRGDLPRLKAWLVARGFEQRYGIDFDETFAPVVKWSTIRTLTASAALHGHQIHHLDVKTAFLYGVLKEEVYMQQPQGYVIPGKEHHAWKLKKALYGLRQSPRMWYERIDSFLRSLGMICSNNDLNLYYIGEGPL
jgi:hypothetical protein